MRPLRVLVCDEERDAVLNLGILLRSEGIEVKLSRKGMEVPREVAEFQPDAVVLDLEMPDRSGLDVAEDLVKCYGSKCPALIAVSSRASLDDRRNAARAGFRYHVARPYDPDTLVRLVLSVIPQ